MSELSWSTRPIREYLAESFAGEWGAEPLPGNVHVLRATDINDEGHVIGSGALRRLPIGKLTSRQLEDGDILLEGSGGGPDKPVGRVAFFNAAEHQSPSVCSNFFKTLRPDRRVVEPSFLWWKLMWFYRQPMLLTFQQQTTGIINLKFEEYLNAAIEVPADLAEQRAIAQILDTLDTAIHETEALIDKLKAVKQGLLHDLLTRGIDANGQLRPPQSEAPQLYKESPLGWIPREWEVSTVEAEFSVDSGITLGAHRVPRNNPKQYLRVANVHRARLLLEDIATLEAPHAEALSRGLHPGDLLVVEGHASTEEIGRCAIADEHVRGMLFQNHLFRLRAKRLLSAFGLLWMNSAFVRAYWRCEAATSSGLNTINRTKLNRLEVAVPPLSEQERIVSGELSFSSRLSGEEYTLEKLRRKKIALMNDLLTGRVRVTALLESVQQVAAQTEA